MTKTCDCGRVIEWNPEMPNPNRPDGKGRMVEVATGQIHKCAVWKGKQTTNQQNKQQAYRGPDQNQVQADVAYLIGDVAVLKERVKELEFTLSGLGEAIAKISVKPASEVEQ